MKIDASWYEKPENVKERTSAGGIIVRKESDDLWIAFARDVGGNDYILPKGGVDEGESILEAAIREIEEEAGFKRLQFIEELGSLQRLSFNKKRWITTYYFLFQTDEVNVTPTEKNRHPKPHWFLLSDLPVMFWPEQKQLILDYRERIKEILLTKR